MSYSISDNEIVVKSEYLVSGWKRWFVLLVYLILILLMVKDGYEYGYEAFINSAKENIPSLIIFFCITSAMINYVFFSNDLIKISDNGFNYKSYKRGSEYDINLNSVSKIKISDENNVIIYDLTNDIDKVINLKKFGRIEIQLLINAVCKKLCVEVDDEIAKEKGISLPDYATTEHKEAFQSRKRAVSNMRKEADNNTIQVKDIPTEDKLIRAAMIDHSSKSAPKGKRRLEL